MRYLHRLHVLLKQLRGLLPHLLTPRPPSSGQATTIGIPHDSGLEQPPPKITQARRM